MSEDKTTLELSANDCADTRAKYLFLICGFAMNKVGLEMLELAAQVMGSYRKLDRCIEPKNEWQSIETAPETQEGINGDHVWVYDTIEQVVRDVLVDGDWWRHMAKSEDCRFSHWMPKQPPPNPPQGAE